MFRNYACKLSNMHTFTKIGSNLKKNGKQTQFCKRFNSSNKANNDSANMKIAYYIGSGVVFIFGVAYASVPLYKVFCQVTGFGGTTQVADEQKSKSVKPVDGAQIIKVQFDSNVHATMPWSFKPTQSQVKIVPGETALAFYTVKNNADYPITGVATYNVYPPKAGLYFNKIQCFCFEEQRLGPLEEIDMPVFFFVDPDFVDDPAMECCQNITLSYTFFKTGDEKVEHAARMVRKAERDKQYEEDAKKVRDNLDVLLQEAERDEVARSSGVVKDVVKTQSVTTK